LRFYTAYRASFYLMLFFSTLVMSIDATDDSKIAILFPLVVAGAAVVALVTVDRDPKLGLSRPMANVLALGSISLIVLEYAMDENQTLLALGHWLVYLQLIKMFLPKTIEDDWFLILLGLMQVLVGGVMSQSDSVGIALFAWALTALWVLHLFSLHRDARRVQQPPGTTVTPALDLSEPYPGLIDARFVFAVLRVAALTLLLGGAIFLMMPRRVSMGNSARGQPISKHLTGFDDTVELGQLGEILENDTIVLSVEFFEGGPEGQTTRIKPVDEPLWRGVTLGTYKNRRWSRQSRRPASFPQPPLMKESDPKTLIQQIRMEPTDGLVLFGIRPMVEVSAPRGNDPEVSAVDGTLSRSESRTGMYEYSVVSTTDLNGPQIKESFPDEEMLEVYLSINPELKAELRKISEPLVAAIDPKDWAARGRALEAYLRDSGTFAYTLQIDVIDPNIDPVLDFIRNRHQGHCEYFASALALMLRSIDIPTRMVNGFKGGDWNDLAGVMTVRQKHAHSWIEMLAPWDRKVRFPRPRWISLDPTPANEREASVRSMGGFTGNFRQVNDFIRYLWVFYVVGYNAERQKRILYEPAMRLYYEAQHGFKIMGDAGRQAWAWLTDFKAPREFFSVRGMLVSMAVLLTLSLLGMLARWAFRRLRRWFRGEVKSDDQQAIGVAFYRRLAQLLSGLGLERPPAETPREFAHRAMVSLNARGGHFSEVADVPPLIVDAFYGVRFGQIDLSPHALLTLESRLDELELGLKPPTT
jgi:transglutaminase-like putative cysteine protease